MVKKSSKDSLIELKALVEGFRKNLKSLQDNNIFEAVIRQEYIDPFWKLLGWDVANKEHRSAAEKDVVIEAPVGTIESERVRSRRPDYIFRIDGFTRFVVEAKKPSIDIQNDRDAIFQAKTYAWSAQIPFVVLTNFEQFRLFDATLKPYHGEPRKGLISEFDLRFEDYADQWDILLKTFSRGAVADGSLEKLLAIIKKVRKGRRIRGIDRMLIDLRGSEPVDRVFLTHLEDYRLRFARALYNENKSNFPDADTKHGAAKLTEATQRLIDRLVFVRVCEDRNIVTYGSLRESVNRAAKDRIDLYPEITGIFRRLDSQYNGYLFKPHFSEQLNIPAILLAEFIRSLYLPEGPYRFDAIGDDILGIIYERFLGSVITVNRGYVDAQEKPEVRHAGGVYYTPRFVVDTIVRRVIGPKIEGKTPMEVLDIKILDPACGSGSFLIAALQYLFDYCTHYISKNPKAVIIPASPRARKRTKKMAFQDKDGNWHLMPDFRGQLISSCLYGVDIDAQAVEVTIMSLYLKLLEAKLPKNWQQDFLESKLLPPMDNNICCGNSLLSQTVFDKYWDNKFGSLFGGDEDIKFRINAFDWNSETRGFGRLLKGRDGFDCIIGNPPYIRVQELKKWEPEECEFYKYHYKSAAKGSYDIYVVFIEKGLRLLNQDGLLGYISPHKYWQSSYGRNIRGLLANGKHIKSIIDFADQQVFRGATTYTAIQVFSKKSVDNSVLYAKVFNLVDGNFQCNSIDNNKKCRGVVSFKAKHPDTSESWFFNTTAQLKILDLLDSNSVNLYPDLVDNIFQGVVTGADDIFLSSKLKPTNLSELVSFYSDVLNKEVLIEPEMVVPVVRRQGFQSYILNSDHLLLLPYNRSNGSLLELPLLRDKYPRTYEYLHNFKERLRLREKGRFENKWWGFSRTQNINKWCNSKILIPYMINRLQAVLDTDGVFFVNVTTGGYGINLEGSALENYPLYVVGLLNSKILDYYLKCRSSHFHSGYYPANKQFIQNLPIKVPKDTEEKKIAKKIENNVKIIIELKQKLLNKTLSDRETERLYRQIESHENQVDELTCLLYGLDKIPS